MCCYVSSRNRERLVALHLMVISVMAVGCATPYQPLRTGGGYSDYRISVDVFSVSFRGNIATREEEVDKYLLRRASELTLEHGFKYFVILSEKGRTRSGTVGYSAFKVPVVSPGVAIQIRCCNEVPPGFESLIDAAAFLRFNFPEVLERLQPPTESSSP